MAGGAVKNITVKAGEIARMIHGIVEGDPERTISGLNKIELAQEHELTFLANPRYKPLVYSSNAGAILVRKDEEFSSPVKATLIRVDDPYLEFMRLIRTFLPPKPSLPVEISSLASVDPTAKVGKNVSVAPFVYIGPNVTIGDNVVLYPGVVLLRDVRIGNDSILYPGVTVREECEIGARVIIHNGTVIGSDGFGFAFQHDHYEKIPQMGKVVIEDDVEIGANCTIDRATLGETRIRKGTKLDNLIHIAHNVVVGEHTMMAAQTGISGSTRVGNYVMMGGQVGIVGHIEIGDRVQIAAQSGVPKSIPAGEIVFGSPARPVGKAKRIEAVISNLPEMYSFVRSMQKNQIAERVAQLEQELENLKKLVNNQRDRK